MYSKMKAYGSDSKSEDSERGFYLDEEEDNESDSETKTISEYDSPSTEVRSQTESCNTENSSNKKKIQINKSNFNSKHSIGKAPKDVTSPSTSLGKHKSNKRKRTKAKSILPYTYENIIGIYLYRTSNLKFKKYIRAPRIKVSIYDVKNCSLLEKSDINRNVIINMEPDHIDHILPIMSREGRLSDDRSFSFTFDECLIINDDIDHIRNENIIIFFEIVDTVVMNFKTRLKLKNSDGWHYISWAFFKPYPLEDNEFNKRQVLQLYKYRKSKRNVTNIFEHWSDSKRKKYPGTLEVAIKDVKYKQDEIEQNRPHTALQKDKNISKLPTEKQNDIRDDQGNFIIASTSDHQGKATPDNCGLASIGNNGDIVKPKVEKMLPLIKLRNFFHLPNKFQCPVQQLKCKQLAQRCLLCRFNENGSLLAYTEGIVDDQRIEEVEVGNKVATINIVIAQVPSLMQQYILKGHTNRINCLRWMPAIMSTKLTVDKQVLLSASEDHTCILWFLGSKGNYSLEVLPHPCAVYSAEFLLAKTGSIFPPHSHSKTVVSIATGGSDTILYIWQIDKITKKLKSKKSQTPTKKTATTQRKLQHTIQLQQEVLKHDSHIVDIVQSRIFGNLFTADVGGTILEWKSQPNESGSSEGRGRGKILWTNIRSFRVSSGLERLQIVDRTDNHGRSILYASTISKATTSQGNAIATVHKIDTKTGQHSEILNRTLSAALINSMTFKFAVVTGQSNTINPSFVLFTSDANRITYLNLKSDMEIETIAINATTAKTTTRTPMPSAPMDKDNDDDQHPYNCIQALDILTTSSSTTTNCEKNILAIALTSNKQLEENYILLYGPRNARDNNNVIMDESTKSFQDVDSCRTSGGSISPTSPDPTTVSRLTSFFNGVLNKCDRIIRYGSANNNSTIGYKLATTIDDGGHSAKDADVNDDVDSDGASIRSDKTFTIENISESSDNENGNQFGNTFSIEENKDEGSRDSTGTFTVEKPVKARKKKVRKDDTDVSEDLDSNK